MNKTWIKAAVLAATLPLAACGSGPSDDDIGQAMTAALSGIDAGKQEVKGSKCAKAASGDAWECDFLWEGTARHGRFSKFDSSWKLVGQLG